jgi:hypothetical protein
VAAENADVADLRRWFSEGTNVSNDAAVAQEVPASIEQPLDKALRCVGLAPNCVAAGETPDGSAAPEWPLLLRRITAASADLGGIAILRLAGGCLFMMHSVLYSQKPPRPARPHPQKGRPGSRP